MKRFWLYMIGVVLVVAAGVAVFLAVSDARDDKSKSDSPSDLATTADSKKACSIFTLADAKQILGDGAKGGAGTPESSSDDLTVSNCTYSQSSGPNAPVNSTKTASLLVRSPQTSAGVQTNRNQFDVLKPANVQNISGYGDNAYWDGEHGQLDILKNNTWYIVSYGPVTPAARTLDQTKQLADLLIDKM